ncbi:unnamed protein product [Rotaria sp. Silwood1]|nr:unnamed protein product [Rotaria sp. Silwood1]CAF1674411.1 unnamed protein product [Rotaria sp. Silwood1]CAF5009596.1 unnamed protein product [Rotaria sp. Silwood1]
MSTTEAYGTKSLNPYVLTNSSSDKQTAHLFSKIQSVQHPSDYGSSSHTPKRNRTQFNSSDATTGRHSTKLHQHQQGTAKTSSSITSPYFNIYHQPKKNYNDSSAPSRRKSFKPTFPPFRITLQYSNKFPATELIIIKEINKYCKLKLIHGRYAKKTNNQMCYLLYISTTAQFQYLMCESNWPEKICNSEYKLDLPTKISSSYSIIVLSGL